MNTQGLSNTNGFGKMFDELFNRSLTDIVGADFTTESPSVNITETDDAFALEVAAPGLEKDDFELTLEKDHLTISVDRAKSQDEDTPSYKRKEYSYQKFSRRFRLPKSVDKDSINAKYDLGILRITMNKTPEAKEKGPRSIDIS